MITPVNATTFRPWKISHINGVVVLRLRLHTSQVAHQAGAYPGFYSMRRLGVFLLPPGWDAGSLQGYPPSITFAGTQLYTWVERGTVRVKCLAREHNTMSPPGLEPGPLAPEPSALTMRPPRLPVVLKGFFK